MFKFENKEKWDRLQEGVYVITMAGYARDPYRNGVNTYVIYKEGKPLVWMNNNNPLTEYEVECINTAAFVRKDKP
jgi:hypothetical protein